jgi:hypothetical protein
VKQDKSVLEPAHQTVEPLDRFFRLLFHGANGVLRRSLATPLGWSSTGFRARRSRRAGSASAPRSDTKTAGGKGLRAPGRRAPHGGLIPLRGDQHTLCRLAGGSVARAGSGRPGSALPPRDRRHSISFSCPSRKPELPADGAFWNLGRGETLLPRISSAAPWGLRPPPTL